ncbi:MAG: glycosyltransferase [Anaerolineae bacterium]|nr:glycosyltransferase [Anaerolineae bacterium]
MKVLIDASDPPSFAPEGLDWCDIYAKINVDDRQIPANYRHKVLPVGPSFGIKLWELPRTMLLAMTRYVRFRAFISHPREYFAGYYRQWRYRLPETAFVPGKSQGNYIFFAGSLWKREPETNVYRANFIRVCSSLEQIQFEGGFAPRTRNDIQGFEELTMVRRIPFDEYLTKLKSSAVAFNTPAVAGCHGWKLAEFLALGKAIISTPLTRTLPSPLEHGVHVHYVDGSPESIRQAVVDICHDDGYRRKLETNAREYYLTYLHPSQVMRRILSAAESIQHNDRNFETRL